MRKIGGINDTGGVNDTVDKDGLGAGTGAGVKVGVISLGCPKNLVDSEAMLGLLKEGGYVVTADESAADVIIVNTCGFIDSAKKESIGAILDASGKKKGGWPRIVVTGCLAERYGGEFAKELPEVDAVLGTGEYSKICETVAALTRGAAGRPALGMGGDAGIAARGPTHGAAPAEPLAGTPAALSPHMSDGARRAQPAAPSASAECDASDAQPDASKLGAAGRPATGAGDRRIAHLSAKRLLTTGGMGYAYVKIAEGCDNRCTFCVIPQLRGAYLSRGVGEIASEVRELARERDMEIILVAQDTTRFGMDRAAASAEPASVPTSAPASASAPAPGIEAAPASESSPESSPASVPTSALSFAPTWGAGAGAAPGAAAGTAPAFGIEAARGGSRLRELIGELSRIEHVRWIRLLYCYPELIGQELIDCFSDCGKLLRYLDLPIQHASDAVLRRMGRRYDRSCLDELVARLRAEIPGVVLRTTLMTGFPGETDEDFSQLKDFVAKSRFDRLGVFAYSREEGTPAASMARQVPKKIAAARRLELIKLQNAIAGDSDAARIGEECEAVIAATAPRFERQPPAKSRIADSNRATQFEYLCRTYGEAPDIDGYVRLKSDSALRMGSFARIRITSASGSGLRAVAVQTAPR
jgi:tRNA A37 methylthiotransferase MiaB